MAVQTKERVTINIPPHSDIKLSRMVLKVKAQGVRCFKQNLLAAMIDYFDREPRRLKEISSSA